MSSLKWTISCCKHSVILSYFAAKVMIFIYFSMMSAAMYDYDKVGNEQEKVCFFLLYLPLSLSHALGTYFLSAYLGHDHLL